MITLNIGIQNTAHIKMARLRMSDKIAAIITMKKPGEQFSPIYTVGWNGSELAMRTDLVKDLTEIDNFYQKTLIAQTAGLPQDLLDSLNQSGNPLHCAKDESTPSGVNGLINWSAKDKSITTSCYQDEKNTKLITSDYSYNDYKTNHVTNVLGKLVNRDLDRQVGYLLMNYTAGSDWYAFTSEINTSQLPGLVVSGTPYLIFDNIQAANILENNREYSAAEAQKHWRPEGCDHEPSSITWANHGSRSYYYLKKTSENTINFNIWEPKSFTADHCSNGNNGGGSNVRINAVVDSVLYWPVIDNSGQSVGESVVFALSQRPGIHDSLAQGSIGLKCLTSNCGADRNQSATSTENGVSWIEIKLKNGKTAAIKLVEDNGKWSFHRDVH